jgi:hypothetical protein
VTQLAHPKKPMPDRCNPAQTVGVLNRFALGYPVPRELTVDLAYAIVDAEANRLIYAIAGRALAFLVRRGRIQRLSGLGEPAINVRESVYANQMLPLETLDSVVFAGERPEAKDEASTDLQLEDRILAQAEDADAESAGALAFSVYRHL